METQFCSTCGGQLEALTSMGCGLPGEFYDITDYVCPTCDE